MVRIIFPYIRKKFVNDIRDQLVMDEDIPEIISGAVGRFHMWTARLDTEEQKDEFIDFVQATWQ